MVKLLVFVLAVATAIDIQKPQKFNATLTEEFDVRSSIYNSSVAKTFFNSEIVHSALKVIEDILFLNEVKACRPNYPNMNTTTFYNHLYCYLVEGGIQTFCNFSDELVKKIKMRVSDFVMFKDLMDASVDCEQWYFTTTRSARDSDLFLGGGLAPEILKVPKLGNIYLGPSKYPLQTIIIRHNIKALTLTSSKTTVSEINTIQTTTINISINESTTNEPPINTTQSELIFSLDDFSRRPAEPSITEDKSNDLPSFAEATQNSIQ